MKRRKILLCFSAVLLLSSCRPVLFPNASSSESTSSTEEAPSSSEELPPEESSSSTPEEPKEDEGSKEEEKDIYDYEVTNKEETMKLSPYLKKNFTKNESTYYDGEFNKKMMIEDKPVIHTHEELVDLLNKLAFYKEDMKSFTIDMTISNGLTTKEELYLAYHDAYMCKDVVSMVPLVNDNEVGVILKYSDDANSFSTIKPNMSDDSYYCVYPYLYNYDSSKTRISSVPYHGTTDLDVHNSDQLLYAVMNGYNPVMKEDSPAKKIYDKAVNILKDIIYTDMTINDKLLAISSYLTNTVREDEEMYEICSYVSKGHNYDSSESTRIFRSFYIEGALFDGCATSHALSKASALLASLLNIDVTITGGKKHSVIKNSISPIYYKESDRNYFDSYMVCIVSNGTDGYGLYDPYFTYAGEGGITSEASFYRKHKMMSNTSNLTYYFGANEHLELSFFFYHEWSEFLLEDNPSYMNTHIINGHPLYFDLDEDHMNFFHDYAELENTIIRYKEEFNITDKQYYYIPYYADFDEMTFDDDAYFMVEVYDHYYLDDEETSFPLYIAEDIDDMTEYGFVCILYR